MPEEQAFSVLVKIMFNYGHREMFKPGFEPLHCMLFQLDKLLEVRVEQKSNTYIDSILTCSCVMIICTV